MFDALFSEVLYFVLGSILAIAGLIRFLTATFPRRARPRRSTYRILGATLLAVGLAIAVPFAPTVFQTLNVLTTPTPRATGRVLAQNETVGGIRFQAGSTVFTMSDGLLVSADLTTPHTIDGLTVTGHVEFWRVSPGKHVISRATLVADQEIPNSAGAWCSSSQPIEMDIEKFYLKECQLARPLTRDTATVPARVDIQYSDRSWSIDSPAGNPPSYVAGIRIPSGWTSFIVFDPGARLTSLSPKRDPPPGTQLWVEIRGIQLTGFIRFHGDPEHLVEGTLWEDALIDGVRHTKGELVDFPI